MINKTTNEIWKSIKGFSQYEVSNMGRIRSWKGEGFLIRKPFRDKKSGRTQIGLYKNCIETNKDINILVLEAFIGKRQRGYETKWKDGDRTNNKLENLAWVKRLKNPHRRKLTDKDVLFVKELLHLGMKRSPIAKKFKVTYQAIRDIESGKTWSHIKFHPSGKEIAA